ncbi:MAG: hypothetical protein WCE23_17535, partial [Candidatus Binatus sp.]|uniref:hypothetical protein n=1 Tax=Candidatus Binatus sp. TaxID=2811406 RepID=UPI003C74214D
KLIGIVETTMSDAKKKLEPIDIKFQIEKSNVSGIKINPKTWHRLLQSVGSQGVAVPGKSGQKDTFSGKPVELDDTIEEEIFEIISN